MRDAVRMNDAEIAAFLAECKSLQVATLGKDGAPHLTTLWFAVHDGLWLFETYGKSQKVVNLRRDPRIAVLCEQGTTYDQLRGVSVQGRAEIVDAGDRLIELMKVIVARNHLGVGEENVARIAAQMAEKRVVVAVHQEKVISWDHRKLSGAASKPPH
jgi:PPOX class probable F420-dependent enzyme